MLKRVPLKRKAGKLKTKKKTPEQLYALQEQRDKDYEFYMSIWNKRKHQSEVSGTPLYRFNKMLFHHICPKHKFPQLRYTEENIIVLTPEEHAKVESDIYFFEEVNKRREILKEKYES